MRSVGGVEVSLDDEILPEALPLPAPADPVSPPVFVGPQPASVLRSNAEENVAGLPLNSTGSILPVPVAEAMVEDPVVTTVADVEMVPMVVREVGYSAVRHGPTVPDRLLETILTITTGRLQIPLVGQRGSGLSNSVGNNASAKILKGSWQRTRHGWPGTQRHTTQLN